MEYLPTFTPKMAQFCRQIFQHHGWDIQVLFWIRSFRRQLILQSSAQLLRILQQDGFSKSKTAMGQRRVAQHQKNLPRGHILLWVYIQIMWLINELHSPH